jgi:hypothetical protein
MLRRCSSGVTATLRAMATSPPAGDLSVEERIGMLVDREWGFHENKRLKRLLKDVRVPAGVCIEDIACDPARGVDKPPVRSLASCQWVRGKQDVIVLGATDLRPVLDRDHLTAPDEELPPGDRRGENRGRDCRRLVHNAHVVALRGGSMRKKKAIAAEGTTETKN